MKNLILQYKLFIYPVVVGVASLILIILIIIPQVQGFLAGQVSIGKEQSKISSLEVKAKGLSEIDQISYNEKLTAALISLPVGRDYSTIIGVFKDLTASVGMTLGSLEVSAGSETEGKNYFTIKMEVLGADDSLEKLFVAIDQSPRTMKLQSLEISSSGGFITASLIVNVYYWPVPEVLGSLDAPLPQFSEKDRVVLSSLTERTKQLPGANVFLPSGKTNPFE